MKFKKALKTTYYLCITPSVKKTKMLAFLSFDLNNYNTSTMNLLDKGLLAK